MICKFCGGEVIWRGPLINLTHTKCLSCGAINSQYKERPEDEEEEDV